MDEGLDRDDKYRMVEDEFLSIAQQFTVHLHAAEYKKQQKMVKVRNAETINSISRPVTGKMPDHTKRKVEGVARSKAQRKALQSVLETKSGEAEDSDESDGDGLPYVGTTLHGLMDSPRGKSRSLAEIRSPGAATRAAAGFQRPAAQSKAAQNKRSRSPVAIVALRLGLPNPENDGATESSDDDDDDLDAPIQAPKLTSTNRGPVPVQSRLESSRSVPSASKAMPLFPTSRPPFETVPTKSFTSKELPSNPEPMPIEASRVELESKARIAHRLEKARLQRAKQEIEEQDKRKLDVIPTFL
jgi:hypothetical protein